jgi:hypothetical protein
MYINFIILTSLVLLDEVTGVPSCCVHFCALYSNSATIYGLRVNKYAAIQCYFVVIPRTVNCNPFHLHVCGTSHNHIQILSCNEYDTLKEAVFSFETCYIAYIQVKFAAFVY